MPTAQLPCAPKLLESPRCWCLRAGKWWSNSSATVRRTPSRRPSTGTLDKKLLAVCKSKRSGFVLGVCFFCLKVSYDFLPSLALRESRVFFPHCCSQLWFLQSFYPALVPQMMGSKVCALDWGNKILFLLLRGFYHGDKLKYDSAGHARGQSPFRRLDGRWGRARNLNQCFGNQCFGSAIDDSCGSADLDLRRPRTRVPNFRGQETKEKE